MTYQVELKARAARDLKGMSSGDRERVAERLRWLEDDLRGDVKRCPSTFQNTGCGRRIGGRFSRSSGTG